MKLLLETRCGLSTSVRHYQGEWNKLNHEPLSRWSLEGLPHQAHRSYFWTILFPGLALDVRSCAKRGKVPRHLLGSVCGHMHARVGLGWDTRHGVWDNTGWVSWMDEDVGFLEGGWMSYLTQFGWPMSVPWPQVRVFSATLLAEQGWSRLISLCPLAITP
jgi:hypothetical protein